MKWFLYALFNWKFEGADIMDWVALITALSSLIALVVVIIQTAREKSSLQRDHTDIKEKIGSEKEKLSGELTECSNEHAALREDHARLHDSNRQILSKVTEIDKLIAVEAERRSASQNLLSEGQREIRHHVEAISDLCREMERLQIENQKLRLENQSLHREIQRLSMLQQQEFSQGQELEQKMDMY